MHNHYIINGTVEFHPATSTLRDLNNHDNVIILNSPASRCLLLLIERIGSIVTQQEFLDIVWTKCGMQVSTNTFYQNISILRKGLKKMGLDEELVVTISRVGLTLASGVYIKKLTSEQQVETSPMPSNGINFDETLQERTLKTQPPLSIQDDGESAITENEEIQPPEHPETRRKTGCRHSLPGVMTGALLTIILSVGFLATSRYVEGQNQYFSHYDFLKTIEGCHIHLSGAIISDKERSSALRRASQFLENCTNYPWVYVTRFPLLPRTSVIRCDKQMNEPNSCVSDYFFEDQ